MGHALGLADDAAEGARVRVEVLPGTEPFDAVVDSRNPYFIGLRGDDALYRFFGRNAFGAPVRIAVHQFAADADQKRTEHARQSWLTGLFS
ncbi:hypothetical protein [Streptomyces sp. 8N616]|uniref:hypothetical protein n=1 Tax=Streptomyces sp. 8N616 TaxID=3457414 RepID=UPI003FD1336C